MRFLLLLFVLCGSSLTAFADTLAGRTGGELLAVRANNPEAMSFSLGQSYTDIAISAFLSSTNFSNNGAGTVYLTNQIGAGTTTANQIASIVLSSLAYAPATATNLFSGLSLDAGTYYLVLQSSSTGGGLGMNIYRNSTNVAAAGNTTNADLLSFGGVAYSPSNSFFATSDPRYATNFLVTGTSAAVAATPEPGSLLLLGTGVLGLVGVARRRYAL